MKQLDEVAKKEFKYGQKIIEEDEKKNLELLNG